MVAMGPRYASFLSVSGGMEDRGRRTIVDAPPAADPSGSRRLPAARRRAGRYGLWWREAVGP